MEKAEASVETRTPLGEAGPRDEPGAPLDGHQSIGAEPRNPAERDDANEGSRRRRLERDLHDGVQNELVALIVELAVAGEDPRVPPALATTLARLETRAQAALDAVRSIARGIHPPLLADFGLAAALRAQVAGAAIHVSLIGSVPRSTEEAEEAAYFSCSEATQNAAKHAGPAARVTLWLHHDDRMLTVLITDDGRGFDPPRAPEGGGLGSIRGRIEELGGSFEVASEPGCGTALTISLPWPARVR